MFGDMVIFILTLLYGILCVFTGIWYQRRHPAPKAIAVYPVHNFSRVDKATAHRTWQIIGDFEWSGTKDEVWKRLSERFGVPCRRTFHPARIDLWATDIDLGAWLTGYFTIIYSPCRPEAKANGDISVSFSTLDRLIKRPPIEPSVADNLWRLLADERNERARNDAAMRNNRLVTEVEKLIPYENFAYLALADAIDRLCRRSRQQ
jgi:hypothetical protein